MQDAEEIMFPFDIDLFTKKSKQMENAIVGVASRMDNLGKTISSSVSKGVINATAKIKIFTMALQSISKNLPEVGKTFSMASEIISKEFFFPIRQTLMPYLQKIMDWVRDNRAMFAKWGNAVASVLRVAINIAKQFFDTIKSIASILVDSLQKTLGTTFKSLDEFLNVLSVKLSFAMLFIKDAIIKLFETIKPTFEYILSKGGEILGFFGELVSDWMSINSYGDSLATVFEKAYQVWDKIVRVIGDALSSFFKGLKQPLADLMTPLDEIFDAFSRLLDIFGDDNSGVKGAFEWLGNFVGNALMLALDQFAWSLQSVVTLILTLVKGIQLLGDLITGDWDSLSKRADDIGDIWEVWWEKTKQTGSREAGYLASAVTGGEYSTKRTPENQRTAGNSIWEAFGDESFSQEYKYVGRLGEGWSWGGVPNNELWQKDNYVVFKNAEGKWGRADLNEERNKGGKDFFNSHLNENATRIDDGFISKDGKVIHLNPNDNIYAFKGLPLGGGGINVPMNMIFNVTVSEGNAQLVGQQLGQSIHNSLVAKLKEQQMLGGY